MGGHNICSVVLTCCRGFPGALMPSRGWSQYLIRHKVIKLLPNCRGSHLPWEPDAQFKSKKYIWDWKINHFYSIIVHLKWKCVHRPLINRKKCAYKFYLDIYKILQKNLNSFFTHSQLSLSPTHTHTVCWIHTNSPQLEMMTFCLVFPSFDPWAWGNSIDTKPLENRTQKKPE